MSSSSLSYQHGPDLAVYRQIEEHQQYWERRWSGTNLKALLKTARTGRLDDLEAPFTRYLPKDGPILEAGCGPGRIVCALQARGYTVEGIDYAAETIARVQAVDPGLDLRPGDIFAIDRPDGYYAAYISLGVLEHHPEGPQKALSEARRVLRPGGVALIMVPYLNRPRRRIYAHAPQLSPVSPPPGFRFYQYQFETGGFARLLTGAGFKIQETLPLQTFEGLVSDFALGRWLHQHHFFSWRLSRALKRLSERLPSTVRQNYSHMMMFIALRGRDSH